MKTFDPSSGIMIKWKCKTGNICHIWKTSISNRTGYNKTGCHIVFIK